MGVDDRLAERLHGDEHEGLAVSANLERRGEARFKYVWGVWRDSFGRARIANINGAGLQQVVTAPLGSKGPRLDISEHPQDGEGQSPSALEYSTTSSPQHSRPSRAVAASPWQTLYRYDRSPGNLGCRQGGAVWSERQALPQRVCVHAAEGGAYGAQRATLHLEKEWRRRAASTSPSCSWRLRSRMGGASGETFSSGGP